ncbi:EF-P 5-aminopentanol modification-associated protein YfmF [Paenibacillus sp. 481]|uniref:EF-P 5-aminopentanol modification-associated protein YfmF n=1 Tax=Paenibacillus sp. 481 TaxID=2835869 RepID=UPI001E53A261|nr:pitrilysin family protein [Paenibacillus sp. 481]UHA73877.1 insulinase family protein [Paenibacillus sp. 481]
MSKPTFERGSVHGIRLHVMPTKRFKTFAISAYVGIPLQEDTVTPTALTPFVLRRGTAEHPETIRFRERLDELYGAGFGFDVYKRGDYQIIQFRMDVINDQFVSAADSLLQQAFQFLGNAVTDPAIEGGAFRNKYVQEEKDTLRKRLEAIVNDKIRYAAERCVEEMCKNEPYRLHPLGNRSDLESIDSNVLYETYRQLLERACIDIYVVGDTSLAEVEQAVSRTFRLQRTGEVKYARAIPVPRIGEPNVVVDRLDVTQGKLNLGLRSTITYADDAYPAALLYNGILGGYPHSKLFVNVREKNSLAYYASSRFDGHKGICTIQSGIEFDNYEKAVRIIREQLEALQAGQIEALELEQTKAMIANQLREIDDSAFEMIGFDFNRVLSGRERTTTQLIEQIQAIDTAHIQTAANTFQLDTIYFLRNREGV